MQNKPIVTDKINNKPKDYSSVQKALNILMVFIPENRELGVLELSRLLNLNKSTISRLLQVLHYYGFVQQNKETKKYSLGKTAASIGASIGISKMDHLALIAGPYLERLRDTVQESVCLEVLSSGAVKILTGVVGPPPLSVSFRDTLSFHAAAGAKAILAYSDQNTIDSYSNIKLKRLTKNTITNLRTFLKQLREIRDEGIAYADGEADTIVNAVGAPVFNYRKKPVAAVCICFPTDRRDSVLIEKNIQELKKTAMQISDKLYYPG